MKAGILIGHLKNKGNEGSLIRTAEAFGINHVFVVGEMQESWTTSEGADRHVTFFKHPTYQKLIKFCSENHHSIVCIENTNEAMDLASVRKYPRNPVFVTGNEKEGVPKQILKAAHLVVKIPQANGYVNCLNTSIAASIVIQDFYSKQFKKRESLWGPK